MSRFCVCTPVSCGSESFMRWYATDNYYEANNIKNSMHDFGSFHVPCESLYASSSAPYVFPNPPPLAMSPANIPSYLRAYFTEREPRISQYSVVSGMGVSINPAGAYVWDTMSHQKM